MLCGWNGPLVFYDVSLWDLAFNFRSTASLIRTVNMEAVITALLSCCRPVACMGDNFINKTGKMWQTDRLPTFAGLEGKSTKARKNFVESLEASRGIRPTRVEDISTFRSADGIAIGVHLQKVSPFVVATFLLSLFFAQVFVFIPKKFGEVLHPIFRIEVNVNCQLLRLRLAKAIAIRPEA